MRDSSLNQRIEAKRLGIANPDLYDTSELSVRIRAARRIEKATTNLRKLGIDPSGTTSLAGLTQMYDAEVQSRVIDLGLEEETTFPYVGHDGNLIELEVVSIDQDRQRITLRNAAGGRKFTRRFDFLAERVYPHLSGDPALNVT